MYVSTLFNVYIIYYYVIYRHQYRYSSMSCFGTVEMVYSYAKYRNNIDNIWNIIESLNVRSTYIHILQKYYFKCYFYLLCK